MPQSGQSGRRLHADAGGLERREVDGDERVDQRRDGAGEVLERLERLQRADHARGRADDAGLGARRRVLGLGRERAAIARGPARDGSPSRARSSRPRRPRSGRCPVAQQAALTSVARLEGVRAVDHEVLALDQADDVALVDARAVGLDHDLRVQEAQLGGGGLGLGLADVRV